MDVLPNEMVDLIIRNLDLESTAHFSLVEHRMHDLAKPYVKPWIAYYLSGKISSKTWFHVNGKIKRVIYYADVDSVNQKVSEMWFNKNGIFDKENRPALTYWYRNGNKFYEKWFRNGDLYRDNCLPYYTEWHENGDKRYEHAKPVSLWDL